MLDDHAKLQLVCDGDFATKLNSNSILNAYRNIVLPYLYVHEKPTRAVIPIRNDSHNNIMFKFTFWLHERHLRNNLRPPWAEETRLTLVAETFPISGNAKVLKSSRLMHHDKCNIKMQELRTSACTSQRLPK